MARTMQVSGRVGRTVARGVRRVGATAAAAAPRGRGTAAAAASSGRGSAAAVASRGRTAAAAAGRGRGSAAAVASRGRTAAAAAGRGRGSRGAARGGRVAPTLSGRGRQLATTRSESARGRDASNNRSRSRSSTLSIPTTVEISDNEMEQRAAEDQRRVSSSSTFGLGGCTICLEANIVEPAMCGSCKNAVGCFACVARWMRANAESHCPLCRERWTDDAEEAISVRLLR